MDIPQTEVEDAFSLVRLDPEFDIKKEEMRNKVQIQIPVDYVEAEELAQTHNMVLRLINDNELPDSVNGCGFTEEELAIMHSDYFKTGYADYIAHNIDYDLDYVVTDPNNKEEYVVQLFLNLYKNYPNDKDDLNYIITEYIRIIENDPNLTKDEKKMVYTAISMAGYSTDYWYDYLSKIE